MRSLALGLVLCITAMTATLAGIGVVRAADSAVILQYHRFGEPDLPSTSVTIEQFESHIRHLQEGGYSVLPVPHIIAALKAGQPLPERTIGITIDDAARSAYTMAWPRLQAAGFPFTIFVSTDAVDQRHRRTMSWEEIRELAAAGVTIGNHSAAHDHMWKMDEPARQADLDRAEKRFREELGFAPGLFAYPFGEFDLALRDMVTERGFDGAFGQQSGVAHQSWDSSALPRFALNENYGDLDRFRLIAATLPLIAIDITPQNPVLTTNPPHIGFTLDPSLSEYADKLACFASGQGQASVDVLGAQRAEVRLTQPFPAGRNRVNCTMPGPDGRWRWLGLQFIAPQ